MLSESGCKIAPNTYYSARSRPPSARAVRDEQLKIYPQGPWKGLDDVEFATLGYIDWFNHRRLHGEITADNSYTTPAEFEDLYYRHDQASRQAVTQ